MRSFSDLSGFPIHDFVMDVPPGTQQIAIVQKAQA